MAPTRALGCPTHTSQYVLPAAAWYLPAAHGAHAEPFALGTSPAAAHATQPVDPACAATPRVPKVSMHCRQVVLPLEGW